MGRLLALSGAALLLLFVVFAAGTAWNEAQRADYGWDPGDGRPQFTSRHPRVLFDEGHNNASTAGLTGRYWPFGRLLRAEGFALERGHGRFTPERLARTEVLVVANASGAAKPQLFGINLPVKARGERRDPAFSATEVAAVREWVERGGALLLIADHAPFGESAAALAAAFGVTFHGGFVEVPDERSDPLLFSRANGRLGGHPILRGDRAGAGVERVMTFTGQSLDGPPGADVLLRLPPGAIEYVPSADSLAPQPAGTAQGIAFERGRGRVVVLGEAALATAQVHRRDHFGMNSPGNDNRRFVLNALRWLARDL